MKKGTSEEFPVIAKNASPHGHRSEHLKDVESSCKRRPKDILVRCIPASHFFVLSVRSSLLSAGDIMFERDERDESFG